jgi:hypothetical protein
MYTDLTDGHTRLKNYLWKLKIQPKIKVFKWFLSKKVLLACDNLAKRNWNGRKECCFYDSEETMSHLFISCPFARLVWRVVYATFDIPPSTNITNIFGNWLNGIGKKTEARIRIGVSALCLSIWKC